MIQWYILSFVFGIGLLLGGVFCLILREGDGRIHLGAIVSCFAGLALMTWGFPEMMWLVDLLVVTPTLAYCIGGWLHGRPQPRHEDDRIVSIRVIGIRNNKLEDMQ